MFLEFQFILSRMELVSKFIINRNHAGQVVDKAGFGFRCGTRAITCRTGGWLSGEKIWQELQRLSIYFAISDCIWMTTSVNPGLIFHFKTRPSWCQGGRSIFLLYSTCLIISWYSFSQSCHGWVWVYRHTQSWSWHYTLIIFTVFAIFWNHEVIVLQQDRLGYIRCVKSFLWVSVIFQLTHSTFSTGNDLL